MRQISQRCFQQRNDVKPKQERCANNYLNHFVKKGSVMEKKRISPARLLRNILAGILCFLLHESFAATNPVFSDTVTRTVKWKYNGYAFSTNLKFSYSDYQYYHGLSKTQAYNRFASENNSHEYLLSLAAQLDADAAAHGVSKTEMAEFLTAFVQQGIPYVKDPYNKGNDYPKYPIETIVDRGGDCEDKSALLVALLNTFGFDAVLIALPGHMAAGLWSDRKGAYYLHKNKRYCYIETTAAWKIGSMPAQYRKSKARLLDVERPPVFTRGPKSALAETGQQIQHAEEAGTDHFFSLMAMAENICCPGRKKSALRSC